MARPRKPASSGADTTGAAQVVERTLNQTRPGYEEHDFRRRRFDAAYDVWRGNTGLNARQNMNDWQSRMRVKLAMQVIDTAMVNLVQGVPKAKVTPRSPQSELPAKAMEQILGYYADLDHLVEQEAIVVQQGLVYGISPGKSCWYYREDSSGNVTDDRPAFEPWDAYGIWWDPTARTVDTAAYIVLQSWMTKDELEQRRYDDDAKTGQYKNLDLLYTAGDGVKPPSTAQNRMMTQPQGATAGKFEIWEIWRKTSAGMRQTILGNRQILLKDGPGPYTMTSYPVTISNTRPDMFRIEGVSESELIDHLQQAHWTVDNLRMEQLKMTVMRGMTVRQTVPDLASLIFRPNYQWVVTDHDDVQFQDPPPLPPEAYKETENILSLMQLVTGITPYVGGASSNASGVDQNTATGVSLMTESASRLLQFKAGIIHQRTWQRTFEHWGALTKQFLKRAQSVRIEGPGGEIDWVGVGPEDINGDFDIRIQAGDESASRAQERSDAVALWNACLQGVLAGIIDPKLLVEKLGTAFGIQNPQALLKPPMPQPQAAPNGPPQLPPGPGVPGGPPGLQLAPPMANGSTNGFHPAASILQGNQ